MLARVFRPRQGLEEMAGVFADNLHDHLAAAGKNLQGEANFLEQSIFVDQLTAESVARLSKVSNQAWRNAFKSVMQEAQARFDEDALKARPEDRTHRARFGAYFYSEDED